MACFKFGLLWMGILAIAGQARGQDAETIYRRAVQLLPQYTQNLIGQIRTVPQFIEGSDDRFWYLRRLPGEKKTWMLVHVTKKRQAPAFDHKDLAGKLAEASGEKVDPQQLPLRDVRFEDAGRIIKFEALKSHYSYNIRKKKLTELEKPDDAVPGLSPDGLWSLGIRENNLWLTSWKEKKSWSLTADGEDRFDYGYWPSWYHVEEVSNPEPQPRDVSANWSPDGKKFVTLRMDRRKASQMYLFQSATESGFRAKVWSYERALPVDEQFSMVTFYLGNVTKEDLKVVASPPLPSSLAWGLPGWSEDSKRLYFTAWDRAYRGVTLFEIDGESGETRVLIEEKSQTNIDTDFTDYRLLGDGREILWASERDGWNHLYLYDGESGRLKHQVTKGDFVVRQVLKVDEDTRTVYFYAGGREQGRDPYYRHFYKVGLDGSGLSLLTPEDAEHDVFLSPDGTYFVDNFSRIDQPTQTLVRRIEDGSEILAVDRADIEGLKNLGWRFPEPFSALARDGKTRIYGAIYRPSDFDKNKKYPVIDATYSGPHYVRTPKSFARMIRSQDSSLAELGFIVVTIDGLGTAKRSKQFHDFSYRNLGDIGSADHMAALRQLADRDPSFDLDRVGIYGHSAGGYDAARALLKHPEFYKVGVSSAGNHDHRMAKIWWPELWMGTLGDHYDAQSNLNMADQLRGKLLLVHGDMDNNVNPASTIRFTAELIKHNRDFDLLIIPNRRHGLADHPYFIRKRMDYFFEHLAGKIPPKSFEVVLPKRD